MSQILVNDSLRSRLPSDIFMELASDTRCEILKLLHETPSQASKIAEALKLTKQETHRNTARLTQIGMIRKDEYGLFCLTEFGKVITDQFSFFQFLNSRKKFFENHAFENIPEKFVRRFGDLQNTELITSVANIFEKLKKIETGAKEYLKIMVPQAWKEEGEILMKLIKNNVTCKTLIAKHSVFPDEINQTVGKQLDKLSLTRDNAEIREIERFGVAVYITEGPCAVMFPNKNGQIEMNSMFMGNDDRLREWCNDVFDYYWINSKPRRVLPSGNSN